MYIDLICKKKTLSVNRWFSCSRRLGGTICGCSSIISLHIVICLWHGRSSSDVTSCNVTRNIIVIIKIIGFGQFLSSGLFSFSRFTNFLIKKKTHLLKITLTCVGQCTNYFVLLLLLAPFASSSEIGKPGRGRVELRVSSPWI